MLCTISFGTPQVLAAVTYDDSNGCGYMGLVDRVKGELKYQATGTVNEIFARFESVLRELNAPFTLHSKNNPVEPSDN
jgi:hypothetical protein